MTDDPGGIARSLRTWPNIRACRTTLGVLISGLTPESPAAPVRLTAIGKPRSCPLARSPHLLMIAGLTQDRNDEASVPNGDYTGVPDSICGWTYLNGRLEGKAAGISCWYKKPSSCSDLEFWIPTTQQRLRYPLHPNTCTKPPELITPQQTQICPLPSSPRSRPPMRSTLLSSPRAISRCPQAGACIHPTPARAVHDPF
jgi:hypothetical protein